MVEVGTKRVLIVAGEASGDLHGGFLVQELQRQMPGVKFAGVGGDHLRARGTKTKNGTPFGKVINTCRCHCQERWGARVDGQNARSNLNS